MSTNPARAFWERFEPIHAVTYFAEEVAEALAATGLKGFWRGYFAARGGPLGPVGPNVVQATFFGFSPELVRKVIPSAWQQASPSAAMAARDDAVEAVLARLLGDVDERTVALLEEAAAACERTMVGRPLYAAHAGMVPPASLTLRLWWACTLLREHRGDGHVAALVAAGVDGCMANVLAVAEGVVPSDRQQTVRGWSDDDWAAGAARVAALGSDRAAFRDAIEARTDELAMGPVAALGPDRFSELCERLDPLVSAVTGSGVIPYPNPVGVTRRSTL